MLNKQNLRFLIPVLNYFQFNVDKTDEHPIICLIVIK